MPTVQPTRSYLDLLNMSKTLYGIGAAGAGAGQHMTEDFGTYVGGGTAMCVGLPLALKGAKAVAWDIPKWTWQNYGNYTNAFNVATQNWREVNFGEAVRAKRNLLLNGVKGNGFLGGLRSAYGIARLEELEKLIPSLNVRSGFDKSKYYKLKQAGKLEEAKAYLEKFKEQKTAKIAKADLYKTAREKVASIKNAIKNGTLKGKELQKAVSELNKVIAECDKNALSLNIKPTSRLGKIKAGLSKYTGAKAINKAIVKGVTSESALIRGASKATKLFVKGGGLFTALFEFAFDLPDICKTFKSAGISEGLKHAGRSATKSVASGIGFAAGAAVGGKIGASIGACIGGPVGALVGGAVGVACGLVGSWAARDLANAGLEAVGAKDIKEKEANQLACEAFNDPGKQQELIAAYEQMISQREQMAEEGIEDAPEATTEQQMPKDYKAQALVLNERA